MRKYTILVMILAIGFMFGGTSYADLNDGLVAYYPFNGNANDESGNEYHGEEYGNIGYVAGKLNKAAIFDGIDDFILVPHNSDLEFGTKSFSISFWMNTSVIPSSRPYIIDKDHSYHSTGLYRFTLEPSGSNDTPAAFFIQRGSTYFDATGSVPVTDGDWHHIVGVRDAEKGVIKLYCDGKEETSTTEFPILDTSSGYPLAFGASSGTHPTSGKHVSFYNGLIDEIRIYNRALSEAEIQELADVESPYKKGDIIINIKDEEGNPLNGYLLVKLPPPVVYPKDLQLEFYPYFHNSALVEESLNGVQNYVLKWFYVSGGKIHFSIYDIEDYIWVTDPGVWVRSPDHQLTLNDTRFIFFYETNEQFNDETIEDKISKTNGGNVTWWTLNYRENDTDPLIQNATLIKKNQSGEQIYDWTYGIFCSGIGQCYFPNHIDRQNFVLEPPYQDGSSLPDSIYNGDKDPVVLIHGINGQAGYWEDNVLRLRNDVDTMNTWVFNYRGTENIANCAYLLKLAIKGIRNFYSNTKKVNLVTHSYGGVITRKYCINYNNEAAKNISKILMLGPPHHGSYGAQRIYTRDALALNQRIWVFQKWTLDPMSPVYKELTPGSNSLMEMVGEKFPSGTQVFIVAGTKTGVAGIFHDEAPNHDDGVVSISSASLL